jgi:hypothetical protein
MRNTIVTLLLCTAVASTLQGQGFSGQPSGKDTLIDDTLFYFFNKHYFKTGIKATNSTTYFGAAATNTEVTHVGSRFENTDPDLTVTGLMTVAAKRKTFPSSSFKIHLYLCNVNSAGLPVMDPIDSVEATLNDTSLKLVGGRFPAGRSHKMAGNFAVLVRNFSLIAGDTAKFLRTVAKTSTNTAATSAEKYSDGNGLIRYAAKFYKATDYQTEGFGIGTDYEMCIAPIVTYTLHSGHLIPPAILNNTVCIFDAFTFTNVSSPELTSRFFNLNELCRKWNQNPPFKPSAMPPNGWPQDSAVFWNFSPNEQGFGWNRPPGPRVNLPYNSPNNTVNFFTAHGVQDVNGADSAVCWPSNKFATRWRSMRAYGRGADYKTSEEFPICIDNCNRMSTGVDGNAEQTTAIWPNPARTHLSFRGLAAGSVVSVTDLCCRLLIVQVAEAAQHRMDLGEISDGIYLVNFQGRDGKTQCRKIVKCGTQ